MNQKTVIKESFNENFNNNNINMTNIFNITITTVVIVFAFLFLKNSINKIIIDLWKFIKTKFSKKKALDKVKYIELRENLKNLLKYFECYATGNPISKKYFEQLDDLNLYLNNVDMEYHTKEMIDNLKELKKIVNEFVVLIAKYTVDGEWWKPWNEINYKEDACNEAKRRMEEFNILQDEFIIKLKEFIKKSNNFLLI